MAEAQIKLGYIIEPFAQFENVNGRPVVGGHIEVFEAGTDTRYITYQDFDYTQNPFKIPLGSDGRAVVLGDSDLAYDVYIYDSFNNLIVSRLNVAAGDAGGVAGGGLRQVIHDDTMTGRGTQLSPLGVSPLTNLAVDETMTAYEATVEGKDSLVLGVNGDWFNSAISGISNDFVTNETFSACCSAVKGGLDNKVDLSALNNYYTKTETWNTFLPRSGLDLSNYYTTAQTYNRYEIEDRLDGKQDKLTFQYDTNSAISSINNSALAGSNGELVPWISGTKHIADTQLMTDNMLIQVLSSFDLSGNKNHCINVKGGMYRFPNQWEIASSIQNTNWFMEKSAMSGYFPTSSFNSFIENGFNPNINALYSSASNLINSANWLINNKLDISAFSSFSANLSGEYLEKSESGNFYPMTGNPSGFLTSHQSLTDYYKKTETSSKEEISAAIAAIPLGDVEVNNVVHNNSAVWNNKLDSSSYHELTAGTNIDIQNYVISSKDWTNTITAASSYAYNLATAQIVEPFDPTYISGQIDNKLNKSESANFYPMTGNPSGFLTQHQSLTNYYTKTDTSSKQEISAALQYISSNAGKTYTGDDPIYVNNTTNHIGITGESLSAGPNIDIFASGGYVVISAEGGNAFPITGTNGTTGFTANMDCSSMMLTTGASPAGGYVKQTTRGVQYEAYPATDVSASWYNIITATNNRSNCYCIRFTNDMTAADLANYSAYDKVTVVHSNEYTPNCMLYWDGNTKVFPSGLYCELVKGTNDQNQTDWFFTTSGWINNLEWDWD